MIQINVSEQELPELQAFYRQEYDKTIKRLQDLKAILSKLNHPTGNGKTHVTKHKAKAIPRATHKTHQQNGHDPKKKLGQWPTFVVDTLKAKGKAMKTVDILPLALKHFNATSPKEKKNTFRNLRGHLYRMAKAGTLTKRKGKGTRDVYYNVH